MNPWTLDLLSVLGIGLDEGDRIEHRFGDRGLMGSYEGGFDYKWPDFESPRWFGRCLRNVVELWMRYVTTRSVAIGGVFNFCAETIELLYTGT